MENDSRSNNRKESPASGEQQPLPASTQTVNPGSLISLSSNVALPLFTTTLFLSAVLLFVIQPFFSKMVLPVLGGAPAVWNTALMFFQGMLLLGYLYAHMLTRQFDFRTQSIIHVALLLLAFISLPVAVSSDWTPPIDSTPVFWLIALFTVSIGLPFFVVSSTAPLMQRWFSYTDHPHAADPYFLYGASNLGALLILLGYPIVIEPYLGLGEQSWAWTAGYGLLVLMIGLCGITVWKTGHLTRQSAFSMRDDDHSSKESSNAISWKLRARWLVLAFIPSALLLGVTLHLTIDVAAAPFIWIIPLALFLLTFVLVFARKPLIRHEWMLRTQVWVYIILAIYFTADDLWLAFGLHLLALFVTAMVCHGQLAKLRPPSHQLTEFYLWMSLGGWLGGVFGAILAPMLFDSVIEYPLIIILAYLVRPRTGRSDVRSYVLDFVLALFFAIFFFLPSVWPALNPSALGAIGPLGFYLIVVAVLYSFRARPVRFALGLTCVIFAWNLIDDSRTVLARERSFFGVYEVRTTETGKLHMLNHGTTLHGAQPADPVYARYPLSYYHSAGPFGQVIESLNDSNRLKSAAVLGLGIGTVACYMKAGQALTFFEIDPVVEEIARNRDYFSYLHYCGENVDVVIGDGRRALARVPDNSFDLLLLDAFSSDAVPVHLLTREALAMYVDKLTDHGILMFNISNRYVDLAPVLARLAEDANLSVLRQSFQPDAKQIDQGALDSEWIIMAQNAEDMAAFDADSRWRSVEQHTDSGLWTDDYSNLFRALVWHRLLWKR